MSHRYLDSQKITNCNVSLPIDAELYININHRERLNSLLAILELLRILIQCHGPSLLSSEAAVLLKRDILVLLFEVLDSLVINIGELHKVFVVIPHALH